MVLFWKMLRNIYLKMCCPEGMQGERMYEEFEQGQEDRCEIVLVD